jgi:lipoprotein-releasing system permease protein
VHYVAIGFEIFGGLLALALLAAVVVAAWNYLFGPRVIRLLINKYLRKRRIAWVSLVAVTLCTAMVIVVISVMGGWLRMFRESFHGLSADIIVSKQSLGGFPHYQEMIDKIEQIDGVSAAVPMIHTFGLVNIASQIQLGVEVTGMPLEKIEKVSHFRESLYRQYQMADDPNVPPQLRAQGEKLKSQPATFDKPLSPEFYRSIQPKAASDVAKWPGMIVGVGVVGIHRDKYGSTIGRELIYDADVKLTVLGMKDEPGTVSADQRTVRGYWIVDDSRTKIWQYDERSVYVPFEILQNDLQMSQYPPNVPPEQADEAARTTDIQIGVKPGYDMYAIKPKVQKVVDDVLIAHKTYYDLDKLRVQTWEEVNAKFLHAVENEKSLVTVLFGIISIVAIFLIFCIFFMIVVEKTRDIGIIKSVGATSGGVAWIFLGYGVTIGVVGGMMGWLVGWLIVHNINELHSWLAKVTGAPIWDPETYAFDTIPNTTNPREVAVIVAIAIVSSLLGALVPAIRAARMHPIEALRWE